MEFTSNCRYVHNVGILVSDMDCSYDSQHLSYDFSFQIYFFYYFLNSKRNKYVL